MQKHGLSFWYAAAFMFGAIQLIALPLLIPSYILEVTGSMVHTGAALSFVGLSGFIAPLIGSTVDRLNLHSAAQKASLAFYAFAMALFAFVPATWAMYLATFLVGLGSITLMTVNPTFIVAAGFDKAQEALRLTRMNQSIFVGAIVMGAILAVAEGISATLSFGIVGVLSIVAMIIVSVDGKVAAQRIVSDAPQQGESEEKGRWNLTFVTFLLAVFIAMLASSNQVAQGPNLFESLFDIDKSATALLLSISSVISLLTLDIAGRALGKFGAGKVWVVGLVGYIVVGTVLSNLVTGSTEYFYLPLVMHLFFMQCLSMVDMVKPAIVAKVTTLPPAATQGFLLFAIAGGYAAGTSLGGVVSEVAGMASLFMFVAVSAAVALAFALFTLARIKD
jgi:predicted MFS family arabinose efflux permease